MAKSGCDFSGHFGTCHNLSHHWSVTLHRDIETSPPIGGGFRVPKSHTKGPTRFLEGQPALNPALMGSRQATTERAREPRHSVSAAMVAEASPLPILGRFPPRREAIGRRGTPTPYGSFPASQGVRRGLGPRFQ